MSEIFTEIKNKIYSFVKQETIQSSQGVDEFVLQSKLEQMEKEYTDLDIKDALESLVDKGYIELNYPESSYVGYYITK